MGLNEAVRETTVAAMERLQVPGVAVGVLQAGEESGEGFGVTSIENPLSVDGTTLFQIGSITKTFTATAVMRLVEQGKLDLDVPVRTYLPELRLAVEDVATRVTLRHALTHVGGWPGDLFEDQGPGDDAIRLMVGKMAGLPQLTALGEVWSYNNVAFNLAGRAIEVVTGQSFERAIQSLLLDPLGMDRTFFFAVDAISYRCAVGHVSFDEGPRVSRPWTAGRSTHPFAGMISCTRDLLRWARFHLSDGTAPDGTRLLQPETLAYMQSPLAPAGSLADSIGITWQSSEVGGVRVVGHGGSWCNQMAVFRMVPERNFAVAVLTNSHRGAELHGEVAASALRHYLGARPAEAADLRLSAEQLATYAGRYNAILDDVRLTVRDGTLVLETVRRGNLLGTKPEAPPSPPVRLAFRAADAVVALDPPAKGNRGEFVRDAAGNIAWFRWGGRIHGRVGETPSR
jgi:CubicO group peptidase (beta-lactamase class C family)